MIQGLGGGCGAKGSVFEKYASVFGMRKKCILKLPHGTQRYINKRERKRERERDKDSSMSIVQLKNGG